MTARQILQPVSSPDENLILVDEQDQPIGTASKHDCHHGEGRLHRAFSIFLWNGRGEVLLQQRSAQKPLWPEYWSNSCCSHPREGESVAEAAQRRLHEELGLTCELRFLYKFIYRAQYGDTGVEHEYCRVFAGETDAPARVHPNEVAAVRYLAPDALTREIARAPERFTPWLKLEWQRIQHDFPELARG